MCDCNEIEVGSYANQVVLNVPPHMRGRRFGCHIIRDRIGVDRCIALELQTLWSLGITTLGCCCGHNAAPAYIHVAPDDAGRMRGLGYELLGGQEGVFRAVGN